MEFPPAPYLQYISATNILYIIFYVLYNSFIIYGMLFSYTLYLSYLTYYPTTYPVVSYRGNPQGTYSLYSEFPFGPPIMDGRPRETSPPLPWSAAQSRGVLAMTRPHDESGRSAARKGPSILSLLRFSEPRLHMHLTRVLGQRCQGGAPLLASSASVGVHIVALRVSPGMSGIYSTYPRDTSPGCNGPGGIGVIPRRNSSF